MVKLWMDATCGMLGRSPDFMNVFLTGLASAADTFGDKDARFADNLRAYYAFVRDNDLCLTHTLVNPQVDRSKPVERQDKDLAAKIVKVFLQFRVFAIFAVLQVIQQIRQIIQPF